jgi:hypothetical protein
VREINIFGNPNLLQQPTYMPDGLTQWRLLLKIQELHTFRNNMIQKPRFKISFELFGTKYEYDLEANWRTEKHAEIPFNRLFYFFSMSNHDVKEFFYETKFVLEFSGVTGTSNVLKRFSCVMQPNSGMRESGRMVLFLENSRVGSLYFTMGLAKDC